MDIANLLSHLAFAHVLGLISLVLTWLMIKRVRILDHPNERSSHDAPTPRSGEPEPPVTAMRFMMISSHGLCSGRPE